MIQYNNQLKMTPIKPIPFPLIFLILFLTSCGPNPGKDRSGSVVNDIDGNEYNTVTIGTQVWMSEDLKVTRYNDGTPIPQVTRNEDWASLTTPAFTWYNNDDTNREEYGALYNWHAVQTGKLCPEGWRVPSDEDWIELISAYESNSKAGGALKEEGTDHWRSPNSGATNESGFTALPGGYRSYNGTFNLLRASGYWWSTTEDSWYGAGNSTGDTASTTVIFYNLRYKEREFYRFISEKSNGFCVRCIMEQ